MKHKSFSFLLALLVSMVASEASASNTSVDGIYYYFNTSAKTATVTYRGDKYNSYSNEYSGSVVIPSTVSYSGSIYSVTSLGKYNQEIKGVTNVEVIPVSA